MNAATKSTPKVKYEPIDAVNDLGDTKVLLERIEHLLLILMEHTDSEYTGILNLSGEDNVGKYFAGRLSLCKALIDVIYFEAGRTIKEVDTMIARASAAL